MRRSSRVRELEPRDLDAILEIGAAFHKESWFAFTEFSFAKCAELFDVALKNDNIQAFVAADSHSDEPVGYIVGSIQEHYWSRDTFCTDVGFYILPPWRGFNAAKRMLLALEEWATDKGVGDFMLGITAGVADDRIVNFYARNGYTKAFYGVQKKSR